MYSHKYAPQVIDKVHKSGVLRSPFLPDFVPQLLNINYRFVILTTSCKSQYCHYPRIQIRYYVPLFLSIVPLCTRHKWKWKWRSIGRCFKHKSVRISFWNFETWKLFETWEVSSFQTSLILWNCCVNSELCKINTICQRSYCIYVLFYTKILILNENFECVNSTFKFSLLFFFIL